MLYHFFAVMRSLFSRLVVYYSLHNEITVVFKSMICHQNRYDLLQQIESTHDLLSFQFFPVNVVLSLPAKFLEISFQSTELSENTVYSGFLGGSDSKESACNVGDPGLIPGLERSPGEGNGYPLQFSSLGNSIEDLGGLQSLGLQRVRYD